MNIVLLCRLKYEILPRMCIVAFPGMEAVRIAYFFFELLKVS